MVPDFISGRPNYVAKGANAELRAHRGKGTSKRKQSLGGSSLSGLCVHSALGSVLQGFVPP